MIKFKEVMSIDGGIIGFSAILVEKIIIGIICNINNRVIAQWVSASTDNDFSI